MSAKKPATYGSANHVTNAKQSDNTKQSSNVRQSSKAKQANTVKRANNAQPASKPAKRGTLVSRIIVVVLIVLAFAATEFSRIQLQAVSTYNDATHDLTELIEEIHDNSADLQTLSVRSQQVIAQFDEASWAGSLILGSTRSHIATNRAVAQALYEYLQSLINDSQTSSSNDGSETINDSSDVDATNADGSPLTEEQKQQIHELLELNNNHSPAMSNADNADDDDDDDSQQSDAADSQDSSANTTVKPW